MSRLQTLLGFGALLVASALLALATSCSAGAPYPHKPIELVVAFAAGGGGDVAGRATAKHLGAALGVQVNVVNKPGSNQIPAVMSALEAPKDGYTLLFDMPATSSIQAALPDLPYKLEDRTFLPMVAEAQSCYVVNGKSPWNSMKDMVEAARKDPESFTYVSSGGLSAGDMAIFELFRAAKLDVTKMKPVLYKGAGEAFPAVAGGHLSMAYAGCGAATGLLKSGDLKVLAVTGSKHWSLFPDIPTMSESGFPDISLIPWFGLAGPRDLPKEVVDRIDAAAKKITSDPAYAEEMDKLTCVPVYLTPDELRAKVVKEAPLYKEIADERMKIGG